MSAEQLDLVLLVCSVVLLAAVAAVRLSASTPLPSLLLYLALGLAIGEGGLGLQFEDAQLTGALGYAALVLILAEGGLTTKWATIRPSLGPAVALAVLGTAVSVVITGVAVHLLFRANWQFALLMGAILAPTDAAAVFSILRRLPLPHRLTGTLEAESGLNDAPSVIIVVALTAQLAHGGEGHPWWSLAGEAMAELVIGTVIGLAVGWLGALGLRQVALPASGLYPISVLALSLGAYGAASAAHGSGFLATYLAALVLGNIRLPYGAAVRSFAEGFGWMAQIGLFVLLGLLASPSRLAGNLVPAIGIGLVLVFLARPLSVLASVCWFGVPLREQVLLSWAGLRGAVPIVLATIPMAAGISGSRDSFDLVFVLVTVFTLVQGPTLPWVARRLGLVGEVSAVDLDVEVSPLGALHADVLLVRIGPTSRLHGIEVFELRLPPKANVTLVIRGDESFVPSPQTMLRHGDEFVVVVPTAQRQRAEQRLHLVSRGGKLAGWNRSRPRDRVGGSRSRSRRDHAQGADEAGWDRVQGSAEAGRDRVRRPDQADEQTTADALSGGIARSGVPSLPDRAYSWHSKRSSAKNGMDGSDATAVQP